MAQTSRHVINEFPKNKRPGLYKQSSPGETLF